jgi:hypothetical protein
MRTLKVPGRVRSAKGGAVFARGSGLRRLDRIPQSAIGTTRLSGQVQVSTMRDTGRRGGDDQWATAQARA